MNNYEQLIQRLIEASPSWEKDGGGIRGRTIAPLLGGSSGANVMEESSPQVFNQQTNRSFEQQEDSLPRISLPTLSSSAFPHPWQIVFRTEDDVLQFKVDLNSKLYSGLKNWGNIEVNGLDSWKTANVGYIILSGEVDEFLECSSANIEGPTNEIEDRISFDEDIQIGFKVILGYLYEDEDGNLTILQNAFQDLTIVSVCVNGKAAIYPMAI